MPIPEANPSTNIGRARLVRRLTPSPCPACAALISSSKYSHRSLTLTNSTIHSHLSMPRNYNTIHSSTIRTLTSLSLTTCSRERTWAQQWRPDRTWDILRYTHSNRTVCTTQ